MNYKRMTALLLALMIMASLFSGCHKEKTTEAPVPPFPATIPEEPPATEPDNPLPPEPQHIAEVYEAAKQENLYRVTQIDTDGYNLESGSLQDGYVLLELRELPKDPFEYADAAYSSEEIVSENQLPDDSEYPVVDEYGEYYYDVEPDWSNNGKLVLFPLLHPEQAAVLEVSGYERIYRLLAGGQVIAFSYDQGYELYDATFNNVFSSGEMSISFLGTTDEGAVWLFDGNNRLEKHLNGEILLSVSIAEPTYVYDFLGEFGNRAYFTFSHESYETYYGFVDLANESYVVEAPFPYTPVMNSGRLCYNSEDRWYLASPEEPALITEFTKPLSDEFFWKIDEHYMLGIHSYFEPESNNILEDLHVYDLSNGGICGTLYSTDFESGCLYSADYCDGTVFVWEQFENGTKRIQMYLWDISELKAAAPAELFRKVDYRAADRQLEELVQAIHDNYNVTIVYDAEGLKAYEGTYELVPCTDRKALGQTLMLLSEWMAEYPEGFYDDLRVNETTEIVFFLCEGHQRNWEFSIDNPSATASSLSDCLQLSIDTHYRDSLRRTLLHETMHLMEDRLDILTVNDRYYYSDYWYQVLNSPEFPSMHSYSDYMFDEQYYPGTYNVEGQEAWYIDPYSKTTPMEDRARVFEQLIYSAGEDYWSAEHLNNKARFLCALMREYFPSVSRSDTPVLWERILGIVDLHAEFPDFTEKQ